MEELINARSVIKNYSKTWAGLMKERKEKITLEQYLVLRTLAIHGKLSQIEVCDEIAMDGPSMSKMLDKMEDLVKRIDGKDKRTKALVLTKKGTEAYESVNRSLRKLRPMPLKQ